MLLCLDIETMKAEFIAAMGGPSAIVGTNQTTVQEFADCLDDMLDHLTRPGSRVYNKDFNRKKFWDKLTITLY